MSCLSDQNFGKHPSLSLFPPPVQSFLCQTASNCIISFEESFFQRPQIAVVMTRYVSAALSERACLRCPSVKQSGSFPLSRCARDHLLPLEE